MRRLASLRSSLPRVILLFVMLMGFAGVANAQKGPPDSLRTRSDTVSSVSRSPTPAASSPSNNQSGKLRAPVTFKARDSLVVNLRSSDKEGMLYGKAKTSYENSTLTAHRINMRLAKDELQAQGLPSDTGLVGQPHFKRGKDKSFSGDRMTYNLRTERGRVSAASTAIQEGFVQGDVVKMMEDSTLYLADASYTTCACKNDPSYSLRADRMKLKGKWVYSGPIQLFLFNIPTPLWLPFGFLPAVQGRRSGPLSFDYGEDGRGFYVRNIGWYQILNEYMDVQITGGYWTSGSWQIRSRFQYNKRYDYNGDFSLDYRLVQSGEEADQNYSESGTIKLQWNHKQDINPYTSFNSDVNLTSSSHLRASEDLDDQIRQDIGSSIDFRKRWPSLGRSFSISARQKQYLQTGKVNLTLPRLSFRQSKRKPFQRANRAPSDDKRWYEKITYQYDGTLRNEFRYPSQNQRLRNGVDSTNLEVPWYEALVSPSTYRRATGEAIPYDFRAEHHIPVSASFKVNRLLGQPFFLSLTPNFDYEEVWRLFRRRLQPKAPSTQSEQQNTEDLTFQRETDFTAIRQFNTSLSANTRFYGTFPVHIGSFHGLRHTARPSISFRYQPDFRNPFWGYTDTYKDSTYTIVNSIRGPQKTINLSINNTFETKRVSTDSTGEKHTDTLPLLRMNASSGYNAARERRPLRNLRVQIRPQFTGDTDVNFRAVLSPYALDDKQHVSDRYVWQDGKLPRLDRLTLTASTNLGPGNARRVSYGSGVRSGGYGGGSSRYGSSGYGSTTSDEPVDFSIPWALSLNFNYDLTRRSGHLKPTATINSSFTLNPTPKWQVRGSTGYNFEDMKFSTTQLRIHRDLGCWDMSINWVPFGRFQQYGFTLQVKSGKLRDLLRLSHPRSSVKGRFQNLLN